MKDERSYMNKQGFTFLPEAVKNGFSKIMEFPIELIVRFNVHPNFFTVLGLILSVIGAYFYAVSNLRLAGVLILLGGLCDTIDGKVARRGGLSSHFGALFDSSLDRYAEFFMFFGVGVHFVRQDSTLAMWTTIMAFLALGGSMMVSYVRARAEGLGYECKVGLMQRAERIVFIGLASLIHEYALIVVIWAIAILANFTAYQRMRHVWKSEKAATNGNSNDHLGI